MPADDTPTEASHEDAAASDERRLDAHRGQPAPEDREREAAWRRAAERERERRAGRGPARDPYTGLASASVASRAFAALAENVRDYAIFLMDTEGVITFWGEGARFIKWWTKGQAEGAHLRLLYPAGGSEDGTAEDHLRQASERGEYTGEGQRMRNDGSTFWAGITLTALRDDHGTLIGFAKVTRDLTARRAADALLQTAAAATESARQAAEAASQAKSGFLATMSHEIRTPVNAIIGYLELLGLETDGPLTAGQRRHLARASASGRHLLTLITEVLDFSRIEAERLRVGRTAFRVGDAVAAALSIVAPDARGRGIRLADAVSGYAGALAVWGDESRVRQILVNLLANAVKFTEARDGEPGRVTVSVGMATQPSPLARLTGSGPWAYVRVEDTGRGIPADRLESMFEPFVQADMSLTRAHGGTGLGLAISRRLARLMGGDVTVRSEVGVGSSFFLWLPAAPVESLQTGGLEGHGPGGEAPAPDEPAAGDVPAESIAPPPVGALRELGDAVLAELEHILQGYVARLRSDPATPSAHGADATQLEDHLASFLSDIAETLNALDVPAGGATTGAKDGTAIQRVVAARHGAQRARLGWTEPELRREFEILSEELASAVARRAARTLPGPALGARQGEGERGVELLAQFVDVAGRISVASFRQAKAAGGNGGGGVAGGEPSPGQSSRA